LSIETDFLKKKIKEEIIKKVNPEIAKIKIYYRLKKELAIEYIPDNKITNLLTALEDIDKNEYENLIKELNKLYFVFLNKSFPLVEYSFGVISIISYMDIPF
jgi:Mg/Co/Ni transporter MgtE